MWSKKRVSFQRPTLREFQDIMTCVIVRMNRASSIGSTSSRKVKINKWHLVQLPWGTEHAKKRFLCNNTITMAINKLFLSFYNFDFAFTGNIYDIKDTRCVWCNGNCGLWKCKTTSKNDNWWNGTSWCHTIQDKALELFSSCAFIFIKQQAVDIVFVPDANALYHLKQGCAPVLKKCARLLN